MNAEIKLIGWLAAQFPDAHVSTRAPADMTGEVIRAHRTGGANDRQLDRVLLDVDCFAAGDVASSNLACLVWGAFTDTLPHISYNGAAYTRVDTIVAPRFLPWDNTNVSRYGATYQIYLAPVSI